MKIFINPIKKIYKHLPKARKKSEPAELNRSGSGRHRGYEFLKVAWKGIVTRGLNLHKHPDADNWGLTTVDIGVRKNLHKLVLWGTEMLLKVKKSWLPRIGATLYPHRGESFSNHKGEIRGQASKGMICAERMNWVWEKATLES